MTNSSFALKSYLTQFKKFKKIEIAYLVIIGIVLSFSLAVIGDGISIETTNLAFGESSILKFLVYSSPFCILWFITKRFFNKYENTNKDLYHSILIFLFFILITSAIIKIPIRKPIYWLPQDYIVYTEVEVGSAEMVVAKGKGIYADDEVAESPTYNILNQGIFLDTDKDFVPETDESSNIYVLKQKCIFWQTAVLMGYNPEGDLAQQIKFSNFPINNFKSFITYLIQLVPIFYFEMFLKTLLSYSLPLIIILCFIVFIVLKSKACSKKEFTRNNS